MGFIPTRTSERSNVLGCINTMYNNHVAAIGKPPAMTYQQILDISVPKANHEMLLNMRSVGALGTYDANSFWLGLGNLEGTDARYKVDVKWDAQWDSALVAPRFPELQHGHDETFEPLRNWASQVCMAKLEWALVRRLFEHLEEQLRSWQELRYVWPSILPLLALDRDLNHVTKAVSEFKVPRNPPVLDMWARAACKQTASTITLASMLEPANTGSIYTEARGYVKLSAGLYGSTQPMPGFPDIQLDTSPFN